MSILVEELELEELRRRAGLPPRTDYIRRLEEAETEEDAMRAREHWAKFNTELPGTTGNWAPYIVRKGADEDGRTVYKVFQQGHEIGSAKLSREGDAVTDLGVLPEHRGRKIATALYKHIEQDIGKPLKRSTYQTPDGNAFWASREKQA